jgi:hypothetical protein
MFQKISDEINDHCQTCPAKSECLKNKCVVYRINSLLHSIFNPSKINIEDFFEPEEESQISLFDPDGGDEM